ncbi:hydroxyacid dehydrogenase [Candidatus Gottesmanbacteria bacterium]|nr:hydroxyacid dehydrogenase [Candidatus Gottesmanbacteria bacterium]
MNVLISDPIDETALEYLTDNHIAFDYKPTIRAETLLEEISRYDGLLVRSRTKVTRDVITAGKNLKVIARIGSGYDNIDVDECRGRKIVVVNSPDANSISVAELTVGLIIALLRDFPKAFSSMKNGLWLKDEFWGGELNGKIVGILGYGYVGKKVDQLVRAFGAKTLIFSKNKKSCTLSQLFSQSDIVTVHLALNSETKEMITQALLRQMKPTAYFLNISRGGVVDERALFSLLSEKKIAGAALDVFWQEPLSENYKWRSLENVILTPHIGAATKEALKRASITVAQDVVRVLKKENPKFSV